MLKQQLQWLIMILDVLCHYDCKIPPKLLTVSINASCFYHNACILALELNMLHINEKDRFWYCSCPNTIFSRLNKRHISVLITAVLPLKRRKPQTCIL